MTRILIQRILGAIWLCDGLLQLKPQMFTSGFITANISSNLPGQPLWLQHLLEWEIFWGSHAEWPFNLIITLTQISIGVMLLSNRYVKTALTLSIVWALLVWLFGEALGNLAFGQWSLKDGAPGAALLYALLGVALWPSADAPIQWNRFAKPLLLTLSLAGWLETAWQSWYYPFATTGFSTVPSHLFALGVLGALAALIWPRLRRLGAAGLIVLSIWAWITMQQAGQFWLPYATDFNSGALWALFALALYGCSSTKKALHITGSGEHSSQSA
ncbi:hypothetical protein [Sulfobacillus sp. hq2]|uniref:hypothetical protein n=1 Tax=Sulfobacillus sp. hq2 TaxID=2039167 RepID=UPI000CD1B003|nr:hypothetical protein [Sulfobacillus sp. hq2]POB09623.1 hypothetical protein CO251_15565 [Sulfobacillus sp. hq2]